MTILKWDFLSIYSFSSCLEKLLFYTTKFWIDNWRFMIVQVSSSSLRWFEKNNFSFRIQSRHFIVVVFGQWRIYCKEMDWELCIRKISKNSIISLKLNSTHLMINPPFNESPHKNDIQYWSGILITYLN